MIWRLAIVAILGAFIIGCSGGDSAETAKVNKDVEKGKPSNVKGGGKPAQMETNP